MISEEVIETINALNEVIRLIYEGKDIGVDIFLEVIDGIVDSMYVLNGTAIGLGIDLEPFYDAVHEANMTKDVGERKPGEKYAKGGGKGPSFKPADLKAILIQQIRKAEENNGSEGIK